MPSEVVTVPRAGGRRTGTVRRAILDAAIDEFQELGYHGTSVRAIAASAGITAGSIYNHFTSKQEILQEIMVRSLTDVITLTRIALRTSSSDPSEQLWHLMHAWALFHTSRRQEAKISITEIRSLDAEGRRMVVALRDEQEALFRAVIYRGVASGDFATVHPLESTRAVLSMGYTIANWYRPTGELSGEQVADAYAELALATVRGPQLPGRGADPVGRGGGR
jgi:AcrR family transcriptional regulator